MLATSDAPGPIERLKQRPPTRLRASSTSTECPARRICRAAVSPARPAPTTITSAVWLGCALLCFLALAACAAAGTAAAAPVAREPATKRRRVNLFLFSVISRVKSRGLFCEAIQLLGVEISVVRAETPGYVGSGGAAQHGGLAGRAAKRHAAQEPGREGVAAAGRVDDVRVERRHALGAGCADDESAVRACGGGDAADALGDQLVGRGFEVPFAREPKHLFLVRQQVVEMFEHRPDPIPDPLRLL